MPERLWSAYVKAVSGDALQAETAAKSHVEPSTISRWRSGREVPTSAAKVASFARAHDRNPLEAFVAAGMLDEAEAGRGLSAAERRFLAELRGSADVDAVTAAVESGIRAARKGYGKSDRTDISGAPRRDAG